MEQFKKKWNKLGVDVPRDVTRDEAIARGYWKAALEWVKSRSEVAKSLYMIDVNDIDNELGVN